jgi:hypothetical protein
LCIAASSYPPLEGRPAWCQGARFMFRTNPDPPNPEPDRLQPIYLQIRKIETVNACSLLKQ